MTSLRLLSAHVRVDLDGLEALPAAVTSRIRGTLGQLEVMASGPRAGIPDLTLRVTAPDGVPCLGSTPVPADPDLAAAVVVAALDRALLAATPCLTIHAAVVAGPRGAAILPAVSGAGKSTLAAACQQAGLLLVSDEAACLDPERDVIWPHPRPLGLDRSSRELLGVPPPPDGPVDGERATAPALLGATAPVTEPVVPWAVVLPTRNDDASSSSVASVGTAEALAVLLSNCLNTGSGRAWDPERAWSRLTRFTRDLKCFRMEYGSPRAGAAALAAVLV
jgi:hypothetical protein